MALSSRSLKNSASSSEASALKDQTSARKDGVKIKGPQFRVSLCQAVEEFWGSGNLADITLTAVGGEKRCHRLVLYSQCLGLRYALLDPTKTTIHVDCPYSTLILILNYIYLNEVKIPEYELHAVREAAHAMGVVELRTKCEELERKHTKVTVENCCTLWLKARQTGDEIMSAKAQNIALNYYSQAKQTQGFRELPVKIILEYLSHHDLNYVPSEDRLGAALHWVRADTEKRTKELERLVQALPLLSMSDRYLEQLLDDPLIQSQPHIHKKIQNILKEVSVSPDPPESSRISGRHPVLQRARIPESNTEQPGEQPKNTPAKPQDPRDALREQCLVFVGAGIGSRRSDEVRAVRLQHGLELVTLGRLPAVFKGYSSCCIDGDFLYVSGLGAKHDQIWMYNLATGKAKQCSKLLTARYRHASAIGSDGLLYIFGGWEPGRRSDTGSVEALDPASGTCMYVGSLLHRQCYRLACCTLSGGDHIVVSGAGDMATHTLQVWSVRAARCTHSISLPYKADSHVNGVMETQGHLVVVAQDYTAVCGVQDLLRGHSQSFRVCDNYATPNMSCGVALSPDAKTMVLIGGTPKAGGPGPASRQYLYAARVQDIIDNAPAGWEPLSASWPLGKCDMNSGNDMANIVIAS